MATSNSLAAISRKLCRNLLSHHKPSCYHHHFTKSLFSTGPSTPELNSDLDEFPALNSDSESTESAPPESPAPAESAPEPVQRRGFTDTVLEGGLDVGIYKAIIVGQVGQSPVQKKLKNGRTVTLTTIGTGGIRNERIPFPNEEPREYADRCNVQWHRVAIYPERWGEIAMKHALPGSMLYLEGNIETKIFTDQITGLVKRIREIAVRQNGRVVYLGSGGDFNQPSMDELRGTGYF